MAGFMLSGCENSLGMQAGSESYKRAVRCAAVTAIVGETMQARGNSGLDAQVVKVSAEFVKRAYYEGKKAGIAEQETDRAIEREAQDLTGGLEAVENSSSDAALANLGGKFQSCAADL